MESASFKFAELACLGLRSLAQQSQLEVRHLVPEEFEQLTLLNVECLTLTTYVYIAQQLNLLKVEARRKP